MEDTDDMTVPSKPVELIQPTLPSLTIITRAYANDHGHGDEFEVSPTVHVWAWVYSMSHLEGRGTILERGLGDSLSLHLLKGSLVSWLVRMIDILNMLIVVRLNLVVRQRRHGGRGWGEAEGALTSIPLYPSQFSDGSRCLLLLLLPATTERLVHAGS